MASHFLLLLAFSFLVALVFAALLREEPIEQVRFGAVLFVSLVVAAVVIGWLMLPLPL